MVKPQSTGCFTVEEPHHQMRLFSTANYLILLHALQGCFGTALLVAVCVLTVYFVWTRDSHKFLSRPPG